MDTIHHIQTQATTRPLPLMNLELKIETQDTLLKHGPLTLSVTLLETEHIIAAATAGGINILYEHPTLDRGRFVNASVVNGAPAPFETTHGTLQYSLDRDKIVFGSFSYFQIRKPDCPLLTQETIQAHLCKHAPLEYHNEIDKIVERSMPLVEQPARKELYYLGHHIIQLLPQARYFLHRRMES